MFSPQRLEIYREKLLFEPPSLTRALLLDDEYMFGMSSSEQTTGKSCFISKRMGVDYENLDERFLPFISLTSSTNNSIHDTIYFRVEPQEGIWGDGGVYNFQITFPQSYPVEPPKVKCLSPLFHPNVHPNTGEVCLPILLQYEWKSCFVISTILMSIQALLCPESDGSYPMLSSATCFINYEASKLARTNFAAFIERTRNYTSIIMMNNYYQPSSSVETMNNHHHNLECNSNNISMDDNFDVMDDDFEN